MGAYDKKWHLCVLIVCVALGWSAPDAAAGSKELYESLSESLDNIVEYNHCREQDKAYGSGDGRKCRDQSQERMNRFQQEFQRRQEMKEAKEDREREQHRLRDERVRELSQGPNVLDEMRTRFGNAVTFEECLTVYAERKLEEYGVMSRGDIRNACLYVVQQVRAYCNNTRDSQCADKGFLRPNETAEALQQQQQEATERRQEQERQRRQAKREEWIRAGGRPGECPSIQAAANKNHPCHY